MLSLHDLSFLLRLGLSLGQHLFVLALGLFLLLAHLFDPFSLDGGPVPGLLSVALHQFVVLFVLFPLLVPLLDPHPVELLLPLLAHVQRLLPQVLQQLYFDLFKLFPPLLNACALLQEQLLLFKLADLDLDLPLASLEVTLERRLGGNLGQKEQATALVNHRQESASLCRPLLHARPFVNRLEARRCHRLG